MKYNKKFILKTGEEITVRSATEKDLDNIKDYCNILFKQTDNFTRGKEDEPVGIENCKKYITNQIFLIVELNKQLIAHTNLSQKSYLNRMKHRCEIGIGVLMEHWHKGIANVLMNEIVKIATEIGYEQMELVVIKSNKNAIKLYNKFGFKKQGVFKNSFKYVNDNYVDGICMIKMLNK